MKTNGQGFVSGQHPSVKASLNKRSGCKSKRKRRAHLGNRLALLGVTFVVGSMAFVVNMRSSSLKEKDLEYQAREESLRKQVDEEKQRAARLEEQRVYVQTKQYIEKVAKEKLGLVNPDEILLKPTE